MRSPVEPAVGGLPYLAETAGISGVLIHQIDIVIAASDRVAGLPGCAAIDRKSILVTHGHPMQRVGKRDAAKLAEKTALALPRLPAIDRVQDIGMIARNRMRDSPSLAGGNHVDIKQAPRRGKRFLLFPFPAGPWIHGIRRVSRSSVQRCEPSKPAPIISLTSVVFIYYFCFSGVY